MAKTPAPAVATEKVAKWAQGAWTPIRCKVWGAMEGATRKEFENWVHAETKLSGCYPAMIKAEHEALIAAENAMRMTCCS